MRRRASRGLDARARDTTTAGDRGWARDILSDRFDARGVPMELCVCVRVTITATSEADYSRRGETGFTLKWHTTAARRGRDGARRESESVDRNHCDRHHFSTYPKYAYAAVKTAQTGASQAPTPNAVATKYAIGKTFNAQNFFTCEAPPRTAVILPANQPS